MRGATVPGILVSSSILNGAEIFYSSANALSAGAVIYVVLLENRGQRRNNRAFREYCANILTLVRSKKNLSPHYILKHCLRF